MGFGYDASNAGRKPITAGVYEVYPTSYVSQLTREKRNPMIVMNYKIRSDVEQAGQGALLQYDNFVDSPNSDWRFNALTKATNVYENKHDFGTMENWAEEMLGKPVRVRVRMIKSSNGNEYPEVSSFSVSENPQMTETPEVKHHGAMNNAVNNVNQNLNQASQAKPQNNSYAPTGGEIDISDDDLPF